MGVKNHFQSGWEDYIPSWEESCFDFFSSFHKSQEGFEHQEQSKNRNQRSPFWSEFSFKQWHDWTSFLLWLRRGFSRYCRDIHRLNYLDFFSVNSLKNLEGKNHKRKPILTLIFLNDLIKVIQWKTLKSLGLLELISMSFMIVKCELNSKLLKELSSPYLIKIFLKAS